MEPSLEYTNILRGSSESEASDLGGMELQPEPEPRPVPGPGPEPEPEPEPRLLDRHRGEPPGGGIRSMLSKLRESQQRELEHTAVDARQVYAEIQARQLQEQIDAMQLSGAASPLGRSAAREDAIRRPGAVLQPQPAGDLPAHAAASLPMLPKAPIKAQRFFASAVGEELHRRLVAPTMGAH